MGQNVIPNILTIRVRKGEYWLEIKMYVLGRKKVQSVLLFIEDAVHWALYAFSDRRVHISGIDFPFLNTCLALAAGM
jgi:hypothetical protein